MAALVTCGKSCALSVRRLQAPRPYRLVNPGQRWRDADLAQQRAKDVGHERAHETSGIVATEACLAQGIQSALDQPQRHHGGGWPADRDHRAQRMGSGELAERPGLELDPFRPARIGHWRELDSGHDRLRHSVEQRCLARHVVVERHDAAAELGSEPAHRHGVDTVVLNQLHRGADDAVTGQLHSANVHSTSVNARVLVVREEEALRGSSGYRPPLFRPMPARMQGWAEPVRAGPRA